ncbi:MAG: nucleotidyltransferase domain-containing protein, partial [Cyanobacteria bacterium P01_A01_bin.135]
KLQQQRRQNECDRQQVLQAALAWLREHGAQFGIEQGYLFGSVTQPGRFTARSDVDLAVAGLTPGDPFGLMSFLSTEVNRDVDLVPLDQCHFAEKIRREGVQWSTSRLLD